MVPLKYDTRCGCVITKRQAPALRISQPNGQAAGPNDSKGTMKRDWDLLRDQLIAIEEDRDFKTAILGEIPDEPKWADYEDWADFEKAHAAYRAIDARICGHLEMLVDNGYIAGVLLSRGAGGDFSYGLADPRLTMAGHDLLETMRSESLWATIKTTAKSKGIELTFDSIKALGAFALKGLLGS
jgi:hypothetical protein